MVDLYLSQQCRSINRAIVGHQLHMYPYIYLIRIIVKKEKCLMLSLSINNTVAVSAPDAGGGGFLNRCRESLLPTAACLGPLPAHRILELPPRPFLFTVRRFEVRLYPVLFFLSFLTSAHTLHHHIRIPFATLPVQA